MIALAGAESATALNIWDEYTLSEQLENPDYTVLSKILAKILAEKPRINAVTINTIGTFYRDVYNRHLTSPTPKDSWLIPLLEEMLKKAITSFEADLPRLSSGQERLNTITVLFNLHTYKLVTPSTDLTKKLINIFLEQSTDDRDQKIASGECDMAANILNGISVSSVPASAWVAEQLKEEIRTRKSPAEIKDAYRLIDYIYGKGSDGQPQLDDMKLKMIEYLVKQSSIQNKDLNLQAYIIDSSQSIRDSITGPPSNTMGFRSQ